MICIVSDSHNDIHSNLHCTVYVQALIYWTSLQDLCVRLIHRHLFRISLSSSRPLFPAANIPVERRWIIAIILPGNINYRLTWRLYLGSKTKIRWRFHDCGYVPYVLCVRIGSHSSWNQASHRRFKKSGSKTVVRLTTWHIYIAVFF